MGPDAWVALFVGVGVMVLTIAGAAWGLSTQLARAITRVETVGTVQAGEIKEIKASVEKLQGVLEVVAVQKTELNALRETVSQNQKRTDATFERLFNRLDNIRIPEPRTA